MDVLSRFLVHPLICWLLLQQSFVLALHQGHNHAHHHHHHIRSLQTNTILSNSTTPEAIVARALTALAEINRLRVQQPAFNTYEFLNRSEAASKGHSAPPLEYGDASENGTVFKTKRQSSSNNSTMNGTSPGAYTIPPELAEAARILAEANTRVAEGNHSIVAAAMREKYSHKLQDTNKPKKHKRPEGLLSKFGNGQEGNSTTLDKRDSGYWMVDMAQRGTAPYATSGYRVGFIQYQADLELPNLS